MRTPGQEAMFGRESRALRVNLLSYRHAPTSLKKTTPVTWESTCSYCGTVFVLRIEEDGSTWWTGAVMSCRSR